MNIDIKYGVATLAIGLAPFIEIADDGRSLRPHFDEWISFHRSLYEALEIWAIISDSPFGTTCDAAIFPVHESNTPVVVEADHCSLPEGYYERVRSLMKTVEVEVTEWEWRPEGGATKKTSIVFEPRQGEADSGVLERMASADYDDRITANVEVTGEWDEESQEYTSWLSNAYSGEVYAKTVRQVIG